jgi:hypothetical protein
VASLPSASVFAAEPKRSLRAPASERSVGAAGVKKRVTVGLQRPAAGQAGLLALVRRTAISTTAEATSRTPPQIASSRSFPRLSTTLPTPLVRGQGTGAAPTAGGTPGRSLFHAQREDLVRWVT